MKYNKFDEMEWMKYECRHILGFKLGEYKNISCEVYLEAYREIIFTNFPQVICIKAQKIVCFYHVKGKNNGEGENCHRLFTIKYYEDILNFMLLVIINPRIEI
jgi:hypothetical protein